MAIKFNKKGFERAKVLIDSGEFETFGKDWKEHQPTPDEVDYFIEHHYMSEYGLWFLGLDTEVPEQLKEHYVFPYGDLKVVHLIALEKIKEKASKQGLKDIADAADELIKMIKKHEMIDKKKA